MKRNLAIAYLIIITLIIPMILSRIDPQQFYIPNGHCTPVALCPEELGGTWKP